MVAGSAGAGHDATDRLRLCRGGPAFPWLPMPRDFLPGFPPPNDIVHSFRAPSTQLILDYFDAAHERTTSISLFVRQRCPRVRPLVRNRYFVIQLT